MQSTSARQRQHTLSDIAQSAEVNKRAAQSWLAKAKAEYGEVGEIISSTRMFSDAERDILLSYQSKRQATDKTPEEPAALPTTATEIQVYEGNHRGSLPVPDMPTEVDLGAFRGDQATVETIDDPMALAHQFINGADAVMNAMAADEKQLANKIAKTRQARRAVAQKADELKRRQQVYSLRTEILANQQTAENEELTDGLAVLQSMGKSAGSGQ